MKSPVRRAFYHQAWLWRHMMAHRETRRNFRLLLAAPSLLVFLLAVVLPLILLLASSRDTTLPSSPAENAILDRHLQVTADSLRLAEAFWNARLALADHKGTSLAIDMKRGVLYLDIEGVPVREVPIRKIHVSRSLARTAPNRLAEWVAQPFVLHRASATIPRVPVRVLHAPKDTTEAQARPPEDVPVETAETHFALRFDRGLVLLVNQPSEGMGSFRRAAFNLQERLYTAGSFFAPILHGDPPPLDYRIHLEVAAADAKAIYRALPDHAGLALYL